MAETLGEFDSEQTVSEKIPDTELEPLPSPPAGDVFGVADFSGGETLTERVMESDRAKMAQLSGYHADRGYLKPENMVSRLSGASSNISGTTPEQTPIAFVWGGATRVIVRDANKKPRAFDTGGTTWTAAGAAGEAIDIITESMPARFGPHVIYCTGGADAKMMTYEPDSGGTKVKPLSFKAPTDYDVDEAPVITQANSPFSQLFSDATSWAAVGTGCTIDTATDTAQMHVSSTTPASHQCHTIDLGAGGVSPTGKVYFVIDVAIHDDPQEYTKTGKFINNSDMLASGYILKFWDDRNCAGNLIAVFSIPRLVPRSLYHRCVFHIGTQTTAILGVSLETAAFFAPPASGNTYTVQVWSQTLTEHWYQKSNLLAPAVTVEDAPWVSNLPPDGDAVDTSSQTSATILQTFDDSLEVASFDQTVPQFRYAYVHLGKNNLGESTYKHMISNPSEQNSYVMADPWREQTVTITPPGASTVNDDYADYFTHFLDYRQIHNGIVWGAWQFVKAIAKDGENAVAWIDKWHACTMADTGDYVDDDGGNHGLVIGEAIKFSGATGGVDPDTTYYASAISVSADTTRFQFAKKRGGGAFAVTADGSNSYRVVNHEDILPEINTYLVPALMETNHDYAASARYACVWNGRVVAACLDRDHTNSEWDRPTAIIISNQDDTDERSLTDLSGITSFPTTSTSDSLPTDGTELDGYAVTGSVVRGLLPRQDELYVFLEDEFFILSGDSPATFRLRRVDAIGCKSAKTIADCRRRMIWHDGNHFYKYEGGYAEPISIDEIDSSLITWTADHNAVYLPDKYLFFCYYDSEWTVLTYDLRKKYWRKRPSDAYGVVGICTESDVGAVYGVTTGGHAVSLYGSTTTDFGATDNIAVRDPHTQYIRIAPPGQMRDIDEFVVEMVTTTWVEAVNITGTVRVKGRLSASQPISFTTASTKAQYRGGLNLTGDSVKIELQNSGSNPPDILFMGVHCPPGEATQS